MRDLNAMVKSCAEVFVYPANRLGRGPSEHPDTARPNFGRRALLGAGALNDPLSTNRGVQGDCHARVAVPVAREMVPPTSRGFTPKYRKPAIFGSVR